MLLVQYCITSEQCKIREEMECTEEHHFFNEMWHFKKQNLFKIYVTRIVLKVHFYSSCKYIHTSHYIKNFKQAVKDSFINVLFFFSSFETNRRNVKMAISGNIFGKL